MYILAALHVPEHGLVMSARCTSCVLFIVCMYFMCQPLCLRQMAYGDVYTPSKKSIMKMDACVKMQKQKVSLSPLTPDCAI